MRQSSLPLFSRLTVAALVLLASLLLAEPVLASVSFAARMARADQRFNQDFESLSQKQDAHKARFGRYWQGLETHSTPPGQQDRSPDRWFNTPTDQRGHGWGKFISFNNMPYSMRMDVYSGRDGDGWVLCARVLEGGKVLERCTGEGAEMRDKDWTVIDAP
jgi:hypothetical protein